MFRTFFLLIPIALAGSLSLSAADEVQPAGNWKIWAPRPEIAPKGSTNSGGEIRLEAAGNAAVFGGWERFYQGIEPGKWYRLKASYQSSGLENDLLQAPVRVDWVNQKGERTGRPEYSWKVEEKDQWHSVTMDFPAPKDATGAKVQLFLQNAARGELRFRDISLTRIETPSPRNVRIASVRLRPRNTEEPVDVFIRTVNDQLKEKVDVILLPEGVSVVGTRKTYIDVAEPLSGNIVTKLEKLARQHGAWVVAGVYEKDGTVVYNTSVLIDRSGKFRGKYRKVYLPREELEAGITPGNEFPVFETDFGKVGMMICWDSQYADPARALALRGAELILMPIWGGNETLTRARAIENHVFVASSGYDYPSSVIDPSGKELIRSETDGTIALTTIDLNRRYDDPWLGNMRGRIYREIRSDVKVNPYQK